MQSLAAFVALESFRRCGCEREKQFGRTPRAATKIVEQIVNRC